jgi:hypothetical protein
MGRRALACLGIASVALTAAPQLAGASSSPTPASRTALENFSCHRSSNSLNRWIEVTGVMRPIARTQHMEMKFQLLRRPPHSRTFVDVSSGDLGKWIHPSNSRLGAQPGDRWSVQKPVLNLSAPATYRFRVSFRWLDSGGHPLDTFVRLSHLCDQY